jgi:hypothetical protein
MTNINDYISDEMLAAYIDGTSTPLESTLVEQQLSDGNIQEVIDLVSDSADLDFIQNVEPFDFTSMIDNYLNPIEEYQELKADIDSSPDDIVL